jgi:aspartyl-tRNA synthetase
MSLVKTTQQLAISTGTALSKHFNGFNIRVRDIDGYIHASDMCKVGKKLWSDYYRNKGTIEFIKELEIVMGISMSQLFQSNTGGDSKLQGTWVHPRIATHLAQWISPEFAVKVTGWIEEWKLTEVKNNDDWLYELHNLKVSKTSQREKEIQLKLKDDLSAEIEIKTKFGYIDLLSKTDIIEIKVANKWKSALGQILSYSDEYPNHKKWLYLFDGVINDDIIILCAKFDVSVKYI